MQFGVDPNLMDENGMTPLRQIFICLKILRSTQLLSRDAERLQDKEGILISVAGLLLSSGADLNLGRIGAEPLLIIAIQSGSVEGVRLLLNAGADVSALQETSKTPVKELCSRKGILILLKF